MYELDKTYTNHFFYTNSISTMPQALFLVPEFIRVFGIKKVLDIGCATGLYLKAFQMNNVSGLGIEGSTIP